MSEDWSSIAGEVSDAIGQVGMPCVLRRSSTPTDVLTQANPYTSETSDETQYDYEVTAFQGSIEVKDSKGTFIGQTMRKLTIAAGGVIPLKSDTIAVGVAISSLTDETIFHDILDIRELAPAGVALSYVLIIAN